jgi:hypothetical protein
MASHVDEQAVNGGGGTAFPAGRTTSLQAGCRVGIWAEDGGAPNQGEVLANQGVGARGSPKTRGVRSCT